MLFKKGMIGIEAPDVWGQNRMTAFRAEFEARMAQNLGQFQLILQAAQRRSDVAVLTNATQLSATVAAAGVAAPRGLGGSRPSAVVVPTVLPTSTTATTPAPAVTVNNSMAGTPSGSGGSGGSGAPGPRRRARRLPEAPAPPPRGRARHPPIPPPFSTTSVRSSAPSKAPSSPFPLISTTSRQATGQPGVGIEPTIQLDEQANYINHLHQLRRVNGGDDLTDMAGYGLYLLRLPVSLVPGPESRKGKGAIVTMEARHELYDDLLQNTFRDVVVMDLTSALTQVINEEIHNLLCLHCTSGLDAAGTTVPVAGRGVVPMSLAYEQGVPPPDDRAAPGEDPNDNWSKPGPNERFQMEARGMIPATKTGSGPNSAAINELRIILGPSSSPNAPQDPSNVPAGAAAPEVKKAGLLRSLAYQIPAHGMGTAMSLPPALRGRDNRLRLLVNAINAGQQDPYRHDPTTLSLIREASWRLIGSCAGTPRGPNCSSSRSFRRWGNDTFARITRRSSRRGKSS